MNQEITVFGPSQGQKLLLLSHDRVVPLKLSTLRDTFDLQGRSFYLTPLGLNEIQAKLEPSTVLGGEDGYLLNYDLYQFYQVSLCKDTSSQGGLQKTDKNSEYFSAGFRSVLELIRCLPIHSSLHVAFQSINIFKQVKELPSQYDGYIGFELPPAGSGRAMHGMEQRNDCHPWTEYVTSNCDLFEGVVRFSRCSGYLRCVNVDCPFYARMHYHNETQWKGRLKRSCPIGFIGNEYGSLVCRHCGQGPECVSICPAVMYYCIPKDNKRTTRCALHLGSHNHPYEESGNRLNVERVEERVLSKAKSNPFTTAKQLETSVARDMIFEMLIGDTHVDGNEIGDGELAELLEYATPLSNSKRMEKCLDYAKRAQSITSKGLEAVLELKNKCKYPFIHSVLFPGQLESRDQPHVFKMSVKGPGSGLDLVNRMRPGGNLEHMWVHFDHVHRVRGWPTMSAHVYDPFIRELLTIATCEFQVEDKFAQITFWRMLNTVVERRGFQKPEFRGFMADEAQANWIAVRTVYFGGAKKIVQEKERSCVFHWEQSMIMHTRRCIKPSSHEDHKNLCRKWKNASSENAAEICKQELRKFWTAGHATDSEIPALETWLAWWDTRAFHWGARFVAQDEAGVFVPQTNLSEAKHASMRASVGYKEHLTLFEASGLDMSLALLQSVRYNAYLKGNRSGTGPGVQDMASRFYTQRATSTSGKRLVELAHASMEEMGVGSPEMQSTSMGLRSVRKKRSEHVHPSIVLDDDSHRPEFITVTESKQYTLQSTAMQTSHKLDIKEAKVPRTMWAIRRTEPKRKMTCFGRLPGQTGRCGQYICNNDMNDACGVPAPCFWGRRKYPGGVVEGFIWFCNISNTHSWIVDEQHIVGPPGPAPGVWPVAEGTSLLPLEITMLQNNGFVLQDASLAANQAPTSSLPSSTPSGYRPKYRDGKMVKWRSRLTKEFQENIQKGRTLDANIIREVIVLSNESHVFYVSTEGSKALGINYSVSIAEFPRCTCPDFQKRESKHQVYIPCKHLYYVFLNVLGLEPLSHEFIHQAALTKIELFQALGSRRINVPI